MPPTNGPDNLTGTTGAESIDALAGDDTINMLTRPPAGPGIDVADGNIGFDTLVVNAAAETQSVQLGFGASPTYTVRSTSGNFYIDAYNMERVLFTAGSGNDSINTGEFGGTVNGGGGLDHWLANLSGLFSNVTFTLGTTTSIVAAGLTSILGIERVSLTTGSGNDTVTGGAQADTIGTGDGNDTVDAKSRPSAEVSIDVVDGGADIDTLIVDGSAETGSVDLTVGNSPTFLVRSASSNFYVDAYNMEIIKFTGGSGADSIQTGRFGGTVNGGGGIDHWIADFSALTKAVTFTLGTTTSIANAGFSSILGLERISMTTGSSTDAIVGGAQADTISTGNGNDLIDAKSRPAAGVAIDVVDGGAGIDVLIVNAAAETQSVSLQTGNSPSFLVRSTSGNFYVDAYNMEIVKFTGGSGGDTIQTANRGGTVAGGAGIDHWIADLGGLTSAVAFILGTTTSISGAGLTAIGGLERLTLTTGGGNDTIVGGAQGDSIVTGNGNDSIDAKTRPSLGPDIDVVDGGMGTDTLIVNASAETQSVGVSVGTSPTFSVRSTSGNFYVDAFNMEIINFTGGAAADTIQTGRFGGSVNGGGAIDHWIADLGALTTDVSFTLGTTTAIAGAGLTSILSVERLTLSTGAGNDKVLGGAQADTLNTGAGNDAVNAKTRPAGGPAIDVVDGGLGTDTLVVDATAETTGVEVTLSGGVLLARSTSGNIYVDAYNMEKFNFLGGSGADNVTGKSDSDLFNGGGGSDTLNSGDGNDTLNGGTGIDTLTGGRGADTLTGGADADIFDYNLVTESSVANAVVDTITDFAVGVDDIDLFGIDANNIAVDGNQAFAFIGANAFGSVRGQLRSVAGIVEADVNGDAVADFRILLSNNVTVGAGDFIL